MLIRTYPFQEPLEECPEFEAIMQGIDNSYWEDHEGLKNEVMEKGLL